MRISAAAVSVLLVLQTERAGAEPSHEGLMLRLTTGVGGISSTNDASPEIELSGGAGFFSFDLGGTLTHGLALHGRLAAHSIRNPTVSIGGNEAGELDDSSLTLGLLGVGLSYYFPSNLYLTGVVGASRAELEVDGAQGNSETGFVLMGDIGYEWPVGGDWGLGIAGRLAYHSIPADDDTRITAGALGVLFSASYY